MDYRQFIGREYQPPHGCFRLIQEVFTEAYGITLNDHAKDLESGAEARMARFQQELSTHCVEVSEPQEGDLIIISLGGRMWHIGVVVEPGQMLHSYSGGSAVIERYPSFTFPKQRINSFWRYVG